MLITMNFMLSIWKEHMHKTTRINAKIDLLQLKEIKKLKRNRHVLFLYESNSVIKKENIKLSCMNTALQDNFDVFKSDQMSVFNSLVQKCISQVVFDGDPEKDRFNAKELKRISETNGKKNRKCKSSLIVSSFVHTRVVVHMT